MFYELIVYGVKCNCCGSKLEQEMHWTDKDVTNDDADNFGWHMPDGLVSEKHYCPDCWELDDDDNVIIKSTDAI